MKQRMQNLYWLLLLVLFPLPLILSLIINFPIEFQDKFLVILLGTWAYSWLLLTLNLGCKPKWLDNKIGLLNIYYIHGVTAIIVLLLMNLHKAFATTKNTATLVGEVGSFIFTVIVLISIITQAGWLTQRFPKLLQVKKWLSKYINHERSVWLHRGLLLATVIITIHFSLMDFVRNIPIFFPLMLVYCGLTLLNYGIYYARSYGKPGQGVIKQVSVLDNNIYELTVTDPQVDKNYLPGKFAFISFPEAEAMQEAHPFSIVKANPETHELTFAIQDCGDFTHLVGELKENQKVKLSKPFGILPKVAEEIPATSPVVLLIGGVGITPFISLVEKLQQEVYIFYSVREDKKFLYQDQLNLWELKPNIHLKKQKQRFSSQEIIEQVPNVQDARIIIAGPMVMNLQFEKDFIAAGVPKDHLFYESFNM